MCDNIFSSTSMLIHAGDKQFRCSMCDKCFTTSSHLKTHELIHTGDKPFSCKICDYSCTQSSNLLVHTYMRLAICM